MESVSVTEVIGFIAAVLTTGGFVPQVVKAIKTKSTKDISLGMYLTITLGVTLWLLYGILLRAAPVIVANGVTLILVSMMLVLKLKYK
ncbi:MAG: SemiSWEET transporter [Planctomycetota bacterium]|nr:SemiSWEET transporter [Planctomycetota bacterium]